MDSSSSSNFTSNTNNRCLVARLAKQQSRRWNVRNLLVAALFLSLFITLLNPLQQVAEGAKLKKEAKKLIKSLAKGFVVSKLSTRKNFMPLPVPIPVPIELSEPPVYLKGKPKYVNVYKATTPAVVKPTTVYHMPVYSPTYQEYSTSMMDPMSLYGPMMAHGGGGSKAYAKHSMAASDPAVESAFSNANFNDFDDDSSNYYIRKVSHPMSAMSASGKRKMAAAHYGGPAFAYGPADEFSKRSDGTKSDSSSRQVDEKESVDSELDSGERSTHPRVKRQVYMSSHEEGPCYGFPLEINVKSRVKLDQVFPIHGKSQFRKCIKVGRPLLPPVQDDEYQRHPYK